MRWRNTTFDDMSHLFRSFDNLFQRFLEDARFAPGSSRRLTGRAEPDTEEGRSLLPSSGGDWAVWQPAVECFTRDKNVVLRAELPGVQPDQVEVTVHNGRLILRGRKESERTVDERDLYFREVAYGRFERSFALPDGVKPDQIQASWDNGVLEVTFPATEAVETKRIPIQSGPRGKKAIQAA